VKCWGYSLEEKPKRTIKTKRGTVRRRVYSKMVCGTKVPWDSRNKSSRNWSICGNASTKV